MLTHLLIMRHAKSSWADPSLTDHQRPLNRRGQRAATLIGQTLSAQSHTPKGQTPKEQTPQGQTSQGHAPNVIWSSDSRRTRETAHLLIRAIPGTQTIHYFSELYHASAEDALALCAQQEEPEGALMLLGHNPGWAALYTYFSGHSHPFPTGACAVFRRHAPANSEQDQMQQPHEKSQLWLKPESWRLLNLWLPRDLDRES